MSSPLLGDEMPFVSPPSSVSRLLPESASVPRELGGLPLVASDRRLSYEQYAFGRSFRSPQSLSAFSRSGGVVLSVSETLSDRPLADSYAEDILTGRISETQVGSFEALVSHAAPDDQGVRVHHVGWIEDGFEFNLSAVRSADELVEMARSIVC